MLTRLEREYFDDIYILGSAPSVKEHDLRKLRGKVSFGVNSSPILENEFCFHSQFYAVSDLRFIKQKHNREIILKKVLNSHVFLRKEIHDKMKIKSSNCLSISCLGRDGFSNVKEGCFFHGGSTVYLAIQAAYALGFRRIFLLGVDLTYNLLDGQKRFSIERTPQPHDPHVSSIIANITKAERQLKSQNIEIYNCSHQSMLRPYIPFIEFEETFK